MQQTKSFNLNEQQKKAVLHKTGPLLVVAGAGTGKTRVITERIKNLIENGTGPKEILALTFTEKASAEMLERLGDVMPLGYEEPWVYTFHSFSDRILKAEGLEIGLDTSYKIISYPEQWLLLRKNIFNLGLKYYLPLGNPTKFISAILKFISRLQDESITPEDFEKFAQNFSGEPEEKERWIELSGVYKKYEQLKLEGSKMDFGDLISWNIRLFKQRPNVLKKYQEQFKHVLIDEFQDTNYAQYELIKMLCPQKSLQKRSLIAVGDDSQSIYKFRGAAVSNIIEFQKDYPESEMVTLSENYRSGQDILDASYRLIQNNNPDTLESKLNISKKLTSKRTDFKEKPMILEVETLEDEVDAIIQKIVDLLAIEPQYTYKDIAILARANNHLDPLVMGLRKRGLPYQLVGNRGLYDREEIRDILAIVKVVVNPLDSISLYRVLNIDVLKIPGEEISRMLSETRYRKTNLWEIVKESKHIQVELFVKMIANYQDKITKDTPVQLVYELVNNTNYISPFLENETVENHLIIKNLNLFLDRVKKFEVDYRSETKEIPTLVDFLDYMELMIEAGDNPAQAEIEDIETINLMTAHASKGLEFPVVFIINLISNRFPTRNRSEQIEIPEDLIKETLPIGDAHIQEERRLFYVGMTRAQKYLFMTYAKSYGGKRDSTPSGFLSETKLPTFQLDLEELRKKGAQKGLFGVDTEFREPKAQKVSDFTPAFLSYTQISTYQTCPLKYKYSYVLNIPTPPSYALSFGSTIHDTLRDFHSKLMFDKDIAYDDLLKMYENNWQPLGYMNEEHRNKYFENGKNLLKKYYEENKNAKKLLEIEKSFNLRINGIKFYGRIDRIDAMENGQVEIIDYKTGKAKEQKDVDKDDQVAFYAMGVKESLGMNPGKLTLYFVEEGKRVSTTRTDAELEQKKEDVKEVLEKIKSGNFEATPGRHCEWCDYKDICPFAYKG